LPLREGTVEAVGKEVSGFEPGDEGFGIGGHRSRNTPRSKSLGAKPANVSFEQAAAVPVSGLTALQAVRDHGQVRAGQSVLIVGRKSSAMPATAPLPVGARPV
jgi:NADPH:quinone reductase-like Zn-dependent oxidoreductase